MTIALQPKLIYRYRLRRSTLRKSMKLAILFYFYLEKGFYMLVDQLPKYYGASATVNPQKQVVRKETLVYHIFWWFIVSPINLIFSSLKEYNSLTVRAKKNKDHFRILSALRTKLYFSIFHFRFSFFFASNM